MTQEDARRAAVEILARLQWRPGLDRQKADTVNSYLQDSLGSYESQVAALAKIIREAAERGQT